MSEWETVLDPVEQAFTVSMPRGWQNRAWLERRGPAAHNLAVSTSPDGTTSLFMGDPSLPYFVDPMAFMPGTAMVARPYTSIEHFLPGYLQHRFGKLPGFRAVHMSPSPEFYQLVLDRVLRSGGTQPWVTAGRLEFELSSPQGTPTRGILLGTCIGLAPMWWVEVLGVMTTGDVEAHVPKLIQLFASRQATPAMLERQMQERAMSAAAHQATMQMIDANTAILRSNHQSNMANLNAMAAGHQQRMDTLHQSHDAANAAWQDRQVAQDAAYTAQRAQQDSSDDRQRQFLNVIAEERTVIDADGNTHQVATGYDRYFRRRSDGTWIGTRSDRDLRGLPGINPDDFDEMKVKF